MLPLDQCADPKWILCCSFLVWYLISKIAASMKAYCFPSFTSGLYLRIENAKCHVEWSESKSSVIVDSVILSVLYSVKILSRTSIPAKALSPLPLTANLHWMRLGAIDLFRFTNHTLISFKSSVHWSKATPNHCEMETGKRPSTQEGCTGPGLMGPNEWQGGLWCQRFPYCLCFGLFSTPPLPCASALQELVPVSQWRKAIFHWLYFPLWDSLCT